MSSTITAGNATNGLALSCDNTGILELKTGTGSGTTAITADASQNVTFAGNVGVGTSSPASMGGTGIQAGASSILETVVSQQTLVGGNAYYTGSAWKAVRTQSGYAAMRLNAVGPGVVSFHQNSASYTAGDTLTNMDGTDIRALIDANGKLLVGSTNSNGGLLKVQAATNICLSVENATAVSGSLTLSTINDAASANIPLDFRASAIYASSGIGTTASGANAFFNNAASNQFLRSTSALKYKTNIRDIESIDVNKFRPVRYNSLCEADDPNKEHFGIIADEVDAAGIKELVTYGENGEIEGFQYERLTVVLLKAIQELKAEVAALKGAA